MTLAEPPRGPRAHPPRRALILAGAALLLVSAILAVGGAVRARQQASAPRPNVLLIVADDMRHDSLWAMPELGKLAERGVTFTRAFATTPLCCPSRASILTGQYAHHHLVRANDPPLGGTDAFDDRSTLATWLRASGVRTGLVGRYLNGYRSLEVPPGWDFWFAILQQGDDNGLYHRYYVNHNAKDEFYGSASDKHSTRVLGRRAVQFVREQPDRPFMLMFTPRAPHPPATPDARDAGAFKARELPPPPPSFDEADVSDKPLAIQAISPLSPAERERLESLRRRQLEALQGLDRELASIVEALRADRRLERTWIIFTSDNGLTLGEHRLGIGKACPYEECVRVPLIVVPPIGEAVGRSDDRLVANIDLAPTIAAIMGTEPATPLDGRSLLPLLGGLPVAWRDALVLQSWNDDFVSRGFVAIRTADRKYVRHDSGEEELYDAVADPYELQSLVGESAWSVEKASLATSLQALLDAPTGESPSR